MKDLKSDANIIVIKADKGNSTVVMDKASYSNQIREMLRDGDIYKRIADKRRNPTTKVESEIQNTLLKLRKSENLTESEYWRLRPFDSSSASFYGLPKIHKVPLIVDQDHFTLREGEPSTVPLRPINSCVGSPTYQLSKYLASLLKCLYSINELSIKNAKEFAEFARAQNINEHETVVSFDVISLFTSVPVDLAKEIIKRKLDETDTWQVHTALTSSQIINLLSLVLDNSYFKFEGEHYHQVSGCAMGSPVSAVIAELVMQEIESKALEKSPVNVRWWRRYVDDSNSCLKKCDVQTFHDHLNSINENIQFTIERSTVSEQGESIAFLDTSITVLKSGQVEVAVHRKATHTEKYLAFDSHHPGQSKAAVVKTLLDRAEAIPSNANKRKSEKENVLKDLKINGYTARFIDNTCEAKQNRQDQASEPRGYTSIPYIKGVSERVKRTLASMNIQTAFKPMLTLGNVFRKPKDRPTEAQVKGIVYKFKCKFCEFTYIGESKRS